MWYFFLLGIEALTRRTQRSVGSIPSIGTETHSAHSSPILPSRVAFWGPYRGNLANIQLFAISFELQARVTGSRSRSPPIEHAPQSVDRDAGRESGEWANLPPYRHCPWPHKHCE